jgi:hypothetical protein
LLTGGFHETAWPTDGLGGSYDRERALDMKTRVGALALWR